MLLEQRPKSAEQCVASAAAEETMMEGAQDNEESSVFVSIRFWSPHVPLKRGVD